ncbi:MAG: substrate-binding domain-containing protein [Oscillospiraceae bacterium]|nr:substrate-binding domain-containing protein [Oscillospiraceae bacterium]
MHITKKEVASIKKRIVLITTELARQFHIDMIRIMSRQAAQLGYDLIILTHFVNYNNVSSHIAGEENIYSLLDSLHMDGAIMDYGSFFNRTLADEIEARLQCRGIPVVALDYDSSRFVSCMQNDEANFMALTEHFIEVHGMRELYCLVGPQEDIHTKRRIRGFAAALEKHGIPFRPEHVFFGDYWIIYAKEFAKKIADGTLRRPQAILCGNDYMALQLSLSLSIHGIRVPEDIAVGGYDGNPDIEMFQPLLTTFGGTSLENAVDAVCMLGMLMGDEPVPISCMAEPALRIGTTCGCRTFLSENAMQNQKRLDESLTNALYLQSSYSSTMNQVTSLDECIGIIAQNLYLLDETSNFHVCLCTDWEGDYAHPERFRREGYTDTMRCVLSRMDGVTLGTKRDFTLAELIPDTYGQPMTCICTPLHYLDRSFGYCVRSFLDDSLEFEKHYGEFCQIAANSIEKIRTLTYEAYLQQKIQQLSERDILTGLYSRKGLSAMIPTLDKNKRHYAVLYYIDGMQRFREQHGEESVKQIMISFSQAINLSCMRRELAAHIGKYSFVIIGECDGTDAAGQQLINVIRSNLKMLEMHRELSIPLTSAHFTAVTDEQTSIEGMFSELEKKLEDYRSSHSESNDAYWAMLRELQYRIYEEPQLAWQASASAQEMGISTSYFQHIYKKNLGISFNADVILARISLAERLLQNTHLSVSEIAEKCGYTDVSYFMKLFKKKNGMTALEYKKKSG